MLAFRNCVRIVGIVLFAAGLFCLPTGHATIPRRSLSAFPRLADTGAFLHLALILMAVGLLLALVSFIMPPRGE